MKCVKCGREIKKGEKYVRFEEASMVGICKLHVHVGCAERVIKYEYAIKV